MATTSTGGNLPPLLKTMNTGGNTPPLLATTTMNTGGNLPPVQVSPQQPVPRSLDGSNYVAQLQPGQAPGPQFSPVNTTMGSLDQITNSNSPYIQNARRRSAERANTRGLLNSSIASGAGERAAIESSMPLFQEAMALHKQREGQAFQGQQSALDRTQQVNRDMLGAEIGDWLNGNQFTREFNGALSLMPVKNAMDLTNAVSRYAIENPELYSPKIVSGMSEFFNKNSISIFQQYFPSMIAPQGGG